jgi:hypothetical protein
VRGLAFLVLLLGGCALGNPQRDYERWQRELEREESGERTIWIDVDHPLVYAYGGAGPTRFFYRDSSGRNEEVDAATYRAGFVGPASLLFDWTDTTEDLSGGTSAETYDLFFFHNRPLWPNRRLRFESRPGVYYDRMNMRGARATDRKPWSIGFRFELEGEVDVVKLRTFNLSVYGSGRAGYGWGRTTTSGTRVDSSSLSLGWEAGIRVQYARIVGSLAWTDREIELQGDRLVDGTEYGFRGPVLTFGMRW